MFRVQLDGSFLHWREEARRALLAEICPDDLDFSVEADLFSTEKMPDWPARRHDEIHVPRDFVTLAESVSYHRHPKKWALLYRLLYRLVFENKQLLSIQSDEDVREISRMRQAVTRDAHKMKAFVRFRKVEKVGEDHYVAWHAPDHPLLRLVGPFFKDRFHVMRWTIFTPDQSATWDGQNLHYGPGARQDEVQSDDKLEELWSCYYASIFNPARVKTRAMKAEMPLRYWQSMPETKLIEELLEAAPSRVEAMLAKAPRTAAHLVGTQGSWEKRLAQLQHCQICKFACGPALSLRPSANAELTLLVENAKGPFVVSAAARAWLTQNFPDRSINILSVIKHPKPDRINPTDVAACKPWLAAELAVLKPKIILCSGLQSALAIFGRLLRWDEVRGRVFETKAAPFTLVTQDIERAIQNPEKGQQLRADIERALLLGHRPLSLPGVELI